MKGWKRRRGRNERSVANQVIHEQKGAPKKVGKSRKGKGKRLLSVTERALEGHDVKQRKKSAGQESARNFERSEPHAHV